MLEELKKLFQGKNFASQIIVINAVIFVVINLLENIFFRGHSGFGQWFALPSSLADLIWQPWTIVTYMFMHGSLGHLVYNMLVFYWFARIFSDFMGNERLAGLYLLGGLFGGLFFLVIYNIMFLSGEAIPMSTLVGASAAVMAVVVATSIRFPTYQMNLLLIGPVQLKWIGLFIFIVSTVLDLSNNFGGKMAHLGGAAVGFVYARTLDRGRDFAFEFNAFLKRFTTVFKRKSKIRVVHSQKPTEKAKATGKSGLTQQEIQAKTDAILDKISKSGYDNLSKDEKDFLFNISNRK